METKRRFRLDSISLKTQLILSFVAITLTVLSATSYYSYKNSMDILQARITDTSLAQFRQIETNVLSLLHEVDKYSSAFIYENDVQTFLLSEQLSNADFIPLEREITKLISHDLTTYDYLDSIYLFLDNGMVIGGTVTQDQSSALIGKSYPFYSNPLYKKIKEDYPNLLYWSGGFQTQDFMRTPLAKTDLNNHLISALRGITSMDSRQISAILPVNAELVVNIKERSLYSLFGNLRSGVKGSMSVVDAQGMVLSSTWEDSIGQRYAFQDKISSADQFGSFTGVRDDQKEEILYYRMGNTGWVLTNEVPLALYTEDTARIQRFTAVVFALSVALIVALSTFWMHRIMRSLQHLVRGMRNVGRGNIGLVLPRASSKEIGQLTEQFNRMSTGILDLMKRNEEAEKEKRRLEIEALQSQINPHFLFNTLNTVKWMAAVSGATNIMECVASLGSMLRPIYYHPSLMWSIREEIDFIRNYANIMNFRYGEEVQFQYDVPEELLECQTLRFMIQPLIENALIHGKANKGTIRLSVFEEDGNVVLAVRDTRGGMAAGLAEELNRQIQAQGEGGAVRGIGLSNVNKRIQLHFGERYGVTVESEEGVGSLVSLKIPILREDGTVQNS